MAMLRKEPALLDSGIAKAAVNETTANPWWCYFSFCCGKSSDEAIDEHCSSDALALAPLRPDDGRHNTSHSLDQPWADEQADGSSHIRSDNMPSIEEDNVGAEEVLLGEYSQLATDPLSIKRTATVGPAPRKCSSFLEDHITRKGLDYVRRIYEVKLTTSGPEPETSERFAVDSGRANKFPDEAMARSIKDGKCSGTPSRRAAIRRDGRPPLSPDKQASMREYAIKLDRFLHGTRDIHQMATKISKTVVKAQVYRSASKQRANAVSKVASCDLMNDKTLPALDTSGTIAPTGHGPPASPVCSPKMRKTATLTRILVSYGTATSTSLHSPTLGTSAPHPLVLKRAHSFSCSSPTADDKVDTMSLNERDQKRARSSSLRRSSYVQDVQEMEFNRRRSNIDYSGPAFSSSRREANQDATFPVHHQAHPRRPISPLVGWIPMGLTTLEGL
jgi:hypothetical protein